MDLLPLNETNAPPGTPLRPYDITYGREQIEQYMARTGERLEDYQHQGTQYVPSGVMLGAYGRLIHESFHYEAGVHVSSNLEFTRTPVMGEPLRVTGDIVRLFERNGDKYVTFNVIISTHAGERLGAVEHTSIYQFRSRAAASSS